MSERSILESMRPQRHLHGDLTTEADPQWRPTNAQRQQAREAAERAKPSPFADRYDNRCPY